MKDTCAIRNGGYVGLVVLLFSLAIITLLFVKLYFRENPIDEDAEIRTIQPLSASGTTPATKAGQMRADIDAAAEAQQILNMHNSTVMGTLDE